MIGLSDPEWQIVCREERAINPGFPRVFANATNRTKQEDPKMSDEKGGVSTEALGDKEEQFRRWQQFLSIKCDPEMVVSTIEHLRNIDPERTKRIITERGIQIPA